MVAIEWAINCVLPIGCKAKLVVDRYGTKLGAHKATATGEIMTSVIEGVDGTGKSTLASVIGDALHSLYGVVIHVHAGPPPDAVRDMDSMDWYMYWTQMLIWLDGLPAVIDRSWVGEAVYAYTRRSDWPDKTDTAGQLQSWMINHSNIQAVSVLHAPPEVAAKRIEARGGGEDHPLLEREADMFKAIIETWPGTYGINSDARLDDIAVRHAISAGFNATLTQLCALKATRHQEELGKW